MSCTDARNQQQHIKSFASGTQKDASEVRKMYKTQMTYVCGRFCRPELLDPVRHSKDVSLHKWNSEAAYC